MAPTTDAVFNGTLFKVLLSATEGALSDNSTIAPELTSYNTTNTSHCGGCVTFVEELDEHYLDQAYLLTFGIMLVFMDLGFGLVEAGSVRSKNTTHVFIKNILDSLTAAIAYWLIGYAFAFGQGNVFIGWHNWAMVDLPETKIAFLFYQAMFASTATTIVAGAVSERCEFKAYLIYSFFITGIIYPIVTHWGWTSQGWLYKGHEFEIDGQMEIIHYEDYGGSGLVHLVGGTLAFVATFLLGPRIGRFHEKTGEAVNFKGHSVALATLGIFVLLFGFMAFNAASQLRITQPGDTVVISMAVFNTLISASFGAVNSLFTHRIGIFGKSWNINAVINGAFVGMVSITGACNSVRPWGAAIIGVVATFVMKGLELLLIKLHIDDPLNAVGIHFGGGIWGTLSVAFLKHNKGILIAWNKRSACMLAWQLTAIVSIITWCTVLGFILFGSLKLARIFRVSAETEIKGLDIAIHEQQAYPEAGHDPEQGDGEHNGHSKTQRPLSQGFVNQAYVKDTRFLVTAEEKAPAYDSIWTLGASTDLRHDDQEEISEMEAAQLMASAMMRRRSTVVNPDTLRTVGFEPRSNKPGSVQW